MHNWGFRVCNQNSNQTKVDAPQVGTNGRAQVKWVLQHTHVLPVVQWLVQSIHRGEIVIIQSLIINGYKSLQILFCMNLTIINNEGYFQLGVGLIFGNYKVTPLCSRSSHGNGEGCMQKSNTIRNSGGEVQFSLQNPILSQLCLRKSNRLYNNFH